MHHCIQGWSGIAQWSGLPLATLAELVRPKPEAKVAVFRSFGEGLYGGEYYDTQQLENALQTQCILAYEMNYEATRPALRGTITAAGGEPARLQKWSSGLEPSSSSPARSRLAKGTAARMRTTSSSTWNRTSNRND